MEQVIYVDVLFALNMLISFFLLLGAKRLCRAQASTLRVLLGSAFGGLYSLVIFLPQVHTALSLFVRAMFLLFVTAVVFGFKSAKKFFRCFACLLAVSFLFAGGVMGLWLAFKPNMLLLRNGAVYIDVSFVFVISCAAGIYSLLWLGGKLLRRNKNEQHQCSAMIYYGGKSVQADAIIDTGNTLVDSFSGARVSVADFSLALRLLPLDTASALAQPMTEGLPRGFRLIPTQTVDGGGIMPIFKAEKMIIKCGDVTKTVNNPTIGVSREEKFCGEYSLLINADLMGGSNDDKQNNSKNKAVLFGQKKQGNTLHKRTANTSAAAQLEAGAACDGENCRR